MSEKAYPWDQQEGETEKAYLAFTCFRELGLGRTIEGSWRAYCEASRKPEKPRKNQKNKKKQSSDRSGKHFHKWVHENNWWERAKAWDYYVTRQANMRFIQRRESILESQFKELDMIAELCITEIKRWKKLQEGKSSVPALSPNVAINGLLSARKLQTDAIKELAEVQAQLDAQMLEGVEEELEFFDPDDYQQ